ncbi:MAG TPA: aldehyde reductase [Polyangiaceae bacterium]|nr:aldehyde reductase [Polyangiaceae bacterium]
MESPQDTLVVVTGASGFIALHCVRELLEQGYRVRGTVRSLGSEAKLRHALLPLEPGDRLSFAEADLLSDAGWTEALAGAKYVLHVASPLPKSPPKDDDELIRPAREGALRVLRAARVAGVARVVMTSSLAAIASGHPHDSGHVFDENDWSDLGRTTGAYEKSKTLAEQAAWEYVRGEGQGLELVAINPSFVLGPSLSGADNASNEIVGKLVRREIPGVPQLEFGLVDVRDLAKAHVLAMTAPNAAGQRFIVSSDTAWMRDIAKTLKGNGYRVPTFEIPNLVARFVALFDPTLRLVTPRLGRPALLSAEKARRELGWSGRSMKEMVLDTAKHISERPPAPTAT